MLWMVNPKRKGRKTVKRKKRATPAQLRALAKARRAKKAKAAGRKRAGKKAATTRKRRKTTTKRRRKATTTKRRTTRRKTTVKRKRATKRRSPRRKARRKTYRRNAPRGFSVRGITRQLQQGVMDALGIEAGKVSANFVSGFIPFGPATMLGNVAKASVSAVVVGVAFRQFLGPQWGRMAMAGALLSPLEALLANVPVVGPLVQGGSLGEYSLPIGEYNLPIGEYVQPEQYQDANMGSYVESYP